MAQVVVLSITATMTFQLSLHVFVAERYAALD